MIVMGVDPGLDKTGYGIIEEKKNVFINHSGSETLNSRLKQNKFRIVAMGTISTSRKDLINDRITKIFNGITSLINKYSPEVVVLEEIYSHYKHPKTAILMGHARGIILLAASIKNIPAKSFSATHLKKVIVGRGNASKQQVKRMIEYLLNIKDSNLNYDITDALSLCLAYIYVNSRDAKLKWQVESRE